MLGTRFTMEQDFYRGRLKDRHDLEVVVPNEADRETVHAVIYEELCQGRVLADSRAQYQQIIQKLVEGGAEAIILGCTEISMLIGPRWIHPFRYSTQPAFMRARLPNGRFPLLRLEHDGFPPESKVYLACREGWPMLLSCLKTLLETGSPMPDFVPESCASNREERNDQAFLAKGVHQNSRPF